MAKPEQAEPAAAAPERIGWGTDGGGRAAAPAAAGTPSRDPAEPGGAGPGPLCPVRLPSRGDGSGPGLWGAGLHHLSLAQTVPGRRPDLPRTTLPPPEDHPQTAMDRRPGAGRARPPPAVSPHGQTAVAGAARPAGDHAQRLDDRSHSGQSETAVPAPGTPCRPGQTGQTPAAVRDPGAERQTAADGAGGPDPARHDAPPAAAGRGAAPVHGDRCGEPVCRGRGSVPGDGRHRESVP